MTEKLRRLGGRDATTARIDGDYALSVGRPDRSPPDGWEWTLLTDLARLESGHTPSRRHPEYWGGPLPWIGIRDATANHGRTIHKTAEYTNDLGIANSAARILPQNTVCLSRTASVGYVVLMGRPMATSQDFVNWVCSKQLDHRFLKYVLMAEGKSLLRFASGSVHQTIYFPEVKSFYVATPPLAEQRAISELLSALDDKIELNKAMNETLEATIQAIFRDWFVDFGPTRRKLNGVPDPVTIMGGLVTDQVRAQELADLFPATLGNDGLPTGWHEEALGAYFARYGGSIQTGPFGSQLHQADYTLVGVPVVMPANLTHSGFGSGAFSFVSPQSIERLDRHRLQTGDVVYGRRGDIGRKALIGKYSNGWLCGTGCLKLSVPPSLVPEYLYYWIDQPRVADWVRSRAIGATMPNLNTSTLSQMPFLVPPSATRAAFGQVTKPMVALKDENDHENRTLAETRNLLLPKLMAGELRLGDAEQELEATQ